MYLADHIVNRQLNIYFCTCIRFMFVSRNMEEEVKTDTQTPNDISRSVSEDNTEHSDSSGPIQAEVCDDQLNADCTGI